MPGVDGNKVECLWQMAQNAVVAVDDDSLLWTWQSNFSNIQGLQALDMQVYLVLAFVLE